MLKCAKCLKDISIEDLICIDIDTTVKIPFVILECPNCSEELVVKDIKIVNYFNRKIRGIALEELKVYDILHTGERDVLKNYRFGEETIIEEDDGWSYTVDMLNNKIYVGLLEVHCFSTTNSEFEYSTEITLDCFLPDDNLFG